MLPGHYLDNISMKVRPCGVLLSTKLPRLLTTELFQLFLSLAVVVASVSAAPRYIVLPIEDVDLSALAGQSLPVYRMPAGLVRQARQVQDEDEFGDSRTSGSNSYSSPAGASGPDHVDYGAYTGGYGAFGWYTDHPVLLGPGAHH